jgi:hypothetical protein
MKRIIMLGLMGLVANGLGAADSGLKEKVTKAAASVGNQMNYSWATATLEADGSPGKLGTIQGKAEKGGVTWLNFTVGGLPVEVCMKGAKGTAKALEGWQSFEELAQAGGTAQTVVRYLRNYKTPVAESATLAEKATELNEVDGAIAGELPEDTVKELLLLGTRQREGQQRAKTDNVKGSVKFWIKDGALARIEIKVSGKVTTGEREANINRTTTVEIKDVGNTKLEVPEEAKLKLS